MSRIEFEKSYYEGNIAGDGLSEEMINYGAVGEFIDEEDATAWKMRVSAFKRWGVPFLEKHKDLFNKYIKSLTCYEEFHEQVDYDIVWDEEKQRSTADDKILADIIMLKQIEYYFDNNKEEECCEWEDYPALTVEQAFRHKPGDETDDE